MAAYNRMLQKRQSAMSTGNAIGPGFGISAMVLSVQAGPPLLEIKRIGGADDIFALVPYGCRIAVVDKKEFGSGGDPIFIFDTASGKISGILEEVNPFAIDVFRTGIVEGCAFVPAYQFIRINIVRISGRLRENKGRASTSRGCYIEVWKVHKRALESFWTALGVAGHSVYYPEGIGDHLGSVSGSSWGSPGGVLGGQEAAMGASWGAKRHCSERLWGVLGTSWRHLRQS